MAEPFENDPEMRAWWEEHRRKTEEEYQEMMAGVMERRKRVYPYIPDGSIYANPPERIPGE